jgi:hypothetical protein
MHANQSDPLPKGTSADIIKLFTDIAQTTDQAAKIMNFPPIDHDSPIWYVSGYFSNFEKFSKSELIQWLC